MSKEQVLIELYNDYIALHNQTFNTKDELIIRRSSPEREFDIEASALVYDYHSATNTSLTEFNLMPSVKFHEKLKLYAFAEYIDYNLWYVIIESTGEVALYDLESDQIEWYCAKSYDCFIDALILAITFFIRQIPLEHPFASKKTEEQGMECIRVSGGDKYETFHKYLLGYGLD